MLRSAFAVLALAAVAVVAVGSAAATIAASAPSATTVMPIPGTALALGMTVTRLDSLIAFESEGRQSGRDRRRGFTRFFGLRADTQLEFESGQLVHARFSVTETSTHSRDYIEDQLRRLGQSRACLRFDAAAHDCVWTGSVQLHVTWNAGLLIADTGAAGAATPDPAEEVAGLAALTQRAAAARAASSSAPAAEARSDSASRAAPTASAAGGAIAAGAGGAAIATIAMPPVTATAASETFLADTLVLGAPRISRSQFIPQLAVPMSAPVMPPAAALAGVQGVVRVLATVDSMGTVNDATILRSIPELDASALGIVRRCRFVSLWSAGHRVGYRVVVPVPFTR